MNPFFQIHRFILFFIVMIYASFELVAQPDPFVNSRNLWIEYNKTRIDSTKIRLLYNLALLSSNFLDDERQADSIGDIAIRIAEKTGNPFLKVIAYNNYIATIGLEQNYHKALEYAEKALKLCRSFKMADLEWLTLHNEVAIYLSKSNFDSASILSNMAMNLAEKLNNPEFKIESYLDIGMSQEGDKKKPEALKIFLTAQELAEKINDKRLLKKCYAMLSILYNLIRTFDKSLEYIQKQQELILANTHPVDSVELMWTQNQKHSIINRFNNLLDEKNIEQVINYSIRTKNIRLKKFEFAIYRQHLIAADKIDALSIVYTKKYPDELKFLMEKDKEMYYRLKAFFKIQEHQNDSAYYYFSLAEKYIHINPNLIYRANFHIRFGQFLKRINKPGEAIKNFAKAYQLAEKDTRFIKMEFMLTASSNLSNLYDTIGDYFHAYEYSEKSSQLRNNISTISNKEKADRMWSEYQIRLDNEKRAIQLRQTSTERKVMAGGIAFLIIVALLIFRNYKNQKRSNKFLDAANKELEAFSYSVSHDLRAPLRRINSFTQIILEEYEDKLDEEGKKICSMIEENSIKMGVLIDDLLAFSRYSRIEIHTSEVEMRTLFLSVFEELTDENSRTRINLTIGDIPNAKCDQSMLKQVVTNLLSNAIKYSSKKLISEIAVSCKNEGATAIYCVEDNGAGFDKKHADKLFRVFQRLHSEMEFEGTGLGLAIVQRIIQRNGGKVWAESEIDKGAKFYFSLPVR